MLLAFHGDLDQAVDMLAMAYLFDEKGVQRTYILDSDNGMPSHTEQDKLVLAVALNRYAKNAGDVCAAIILMFAILPGDDSDLKKRRKLVDSTLTGLDLAPLSWASRMRPRFSKALLLLSPKTGVWLLQASKRVCVYREKVAIS